MQIDSHQHFWQYNATDYDWMGDEHAVIRKDFLPEDLAPLLAHSSIAGCVAVQARQSLPETDFLRIAKPEEIKVCDPACGTAGFLIAASEHLVEHYSETIYKDAAARRRFNDHTFHGYDFDPTMLRIGSMNMLLHGVENPDIRYKDSLAESEEDDAERYSLILANPPFAGSLDYESTAKDLQQIVKTKKTELLFLALFLRLLQTGGRAAVIVPDGVLFGSSKAHKELRRILVEDQKLDAIISMPSGVFKPYAGVSTAILLFTRTDSGGTDDVWFYRMEADGYSLDDKRSSIDDNDIPAD